MIILCSNYFWSTSIAFRLSWFLTFYKKLRGFLGKKTMTEHLADSGCFWINLGTGIIVQNIKVGQARDWHETELSGMKKNQDGSGRPNADSRSVN